MGGKPACQNSNSPKLVHSEFNKQVGQLVLVRKQLVVCVVPFVQILIQYIILYQKLFGIF